MALVLDGGSQTWGTLAAATGYAVAFIYGTWRREHARFWPIPVLGLLLDAVKEIFLASDPPLWPGMFWGALLYPVYCMAACIGGIMIRVMLEKSEPPRAEGWKSGTHGNFPPYQV